MGIRINSGGQNFYTAENTVKTQNAKVNTDTKIDEAGKSGLYAGGRLTIDTYKSDTQKDFIKRGLYKHAEKAGLPEEECIAFAEKWAGNTLYHQANGITTAYTAKEFARLKAQGKADFDLTAEYSPDALKDLQQRQAQYISRQAQINSNIPVAVMSAPNLNEQESAVQTITGFVTSITGTESEVGKQLNRAAVSTLRLMGNLQELQNKATGAFTEIVREVAPDSVDGFLDRYDQIQNRQALALKNARSEVTAQDTEDDLRNAKLGKNPGLATDLANKAAYLPEGIPNAIDSAIKGDFKADDGSYSDTVGKIIGGVNPAGDVRDIIANTKNVILGKDGAGVALGASIIGAIPLIGDGRKIIYKSEKKAITEAVEKFVKQGIERETAEKLAKEEVGKIAKEAEEKISRESAKAGAKTGKLIIEDGRALSKSEQEFADKMLGEGKVIKARKESTEIGVKNPDFEIDGEIVEFKYVSDLKGTNADKLSGGLSRRILDGGSQASKVTLNVSDQTEMTREIAERAVKRAFGNQEFRGSSKIREVRIYGKDFDITIPFISNK